jgi:cell division transport system permease protein
MSPIELLETRITGVVRAVTGAGEPELVPQSRLSGPMPWVIAIMVTMTVIAMAAGLALRNTVVSAQAGLEGGITVQIVEPRAGERQAQSKAALERLRALPGVTGARLVPQDELDRLIEPWLGSDGGSASTMAIPVPALIDVQLAEQASEARVGEIGAALAKVAPAARVDAQSGWLEPVYDAIASLQWLAIALVLLLALALAAAVLMAARSALGTNRETIEIVHLLGGTDAQIARVFQRSMGVDAIGGGVVGFALAVVVILFLGRRFAGLGAGMVESGALGWSDWLLLAMVPVAAALLAMLTARLTVMHALRKML